MKKMLIPLLVASAFASAQQTDEQKVFGTTAGISAMPPARQGQTKQAAAKPAAGSEKKLQPQMRAKQMYDRFVSGDVLYASKLKEDANAGNPWAALNYGLLAHVGRLPGQRGPDLALAHKAYMKAVKNADGSLTGNHLAAYNLGLIYYYGGKGFPKNGKEAYKWFGLATQAYREYKKSQSSIFWPAALYRAQILEYGYAGMKADKTAALSEWQAAARYNDPAALFGYARAAASENPFVAVMAYKKAADRWHVPSMLALAKWYSTTDRVHHTDPVQASVWLQTAALVERKYAANAAAYSRHLNAKQQQNATEQATRWLKSKGLKPKPRNYADPLNEDPTGV